jgi:hypothetical protein
MIRGAATDTIGSLEEAALAHPLLAFETLVRPIPVRRQPKV